MHSYKQTPRVLSLNPMRSTPPTPAARTSWTQQTSESFKRVAVWPAAAARDARRRYNLVLAQDLAVLAFQMKGTTPLSSVTRDGGKFNIHTGDKAMMWNPPMSGTLCLTYESMHMPPMLDSCFPNAEILFTLFALSKSVMISQRRALIELVTSSDN